jgi:hypothetical protein
MLGQCIQGSDAVGLILVSVLPHMSSSPGVAVGTPVKHKRTEIHCIIYKLSVDAMA